MKTAGIITLNNPSPLNNPGLVGYGLSLFRITPEAANIPTNPIPKAPPIARAIISWSAIQATLNFLAQSSHLGHQPLYRPVLESSTWLEWRSKRLSHEPHFSRP